MTLVFTDYLFILSIWIALIIYWGLGNKPRAQNVVLLITCYFIYGFINYWVVIIIFISTIINYFFGIIIGKDFKKNSNKKLVLFSSIIFNVVYLFIFKYFNFFSYEISHFLSIFGLEIEPILLNIFLPIGISFYTLQLIAYNVEIYRKEINSCRNFIKFCIFVAFFPKLTAGPIEHPKNFIPQLDKEKKFFDYYEKGGFQGAFQLLLLGYFKKIVIADVIAKQISGFYLNPTSYTSTEAKIIVLLFTIQIYADFSGYSDIARGISRLFGFELMINFNQPYLATNIQDFWRRWHISLMEWFREYLYKPLGGSWKGIKRLMLNLLIIFIISGIWHGVGLNFILWGFFHGLYIMFFRYIKYLKDKDDNIRENKKLILIRFQNTNFFLKIKKFIGWFLTFQVINFLWIFFRAYDIQSAFLIIQIVYTTPINLSIGILENKLFRILILSVLLSFTIDILQYKFHDHEIFKHFHWFLRGIVYALMIMMVLMFSDIFTNYEPFIYQGF
ncbi:MAG: MBOAT family O-acyltransferase [Promethearchaeia archaeon]